MGRDPLKVYPDQVGAQYMSKVMDLLRKHGSVVLPTAWDPQAFAEKIQSVAPDSVIITGRVQHFLGEALEIGYPMLHMRINLDSEGIVIEEVERLPKDDAPQVTVHRDSFINRVEIPIPHTELFDILRVLGVSHIRYNAFPTHGAIDKTVVQIHATEADKVRFIEVLNTYLRKVHKKDKSLKDLEERVDIRDHTPADGTPVLSPIQAERALADASEPGAPFFPIDSAEGRRLTDSFEALGNSEG
jgi:hypothetical protein